MRILSVADLHYSLPQFDWVVKVAPRYDVVVIAGDLLDGNAFVTTSAQMVTVLKYLERLRELTTLLVCSGNHDLNHAYSTGERYARWIQHARSQTAHVDGDTVAVGDIVFTVFPWWDGALAKAAIGRQLAAAPRRQDQTWVWIYHAPPGEVPVAWSGQRYFGDAALAGWIGEYHPALVISGHVHEAPFTRGGGWVSRLGSTLIFNAGRQVGDVPTHIAFDTDAGEAAWFSFEGAETVALATSQPTEARAMTALPVWLPR